MIGGRRGGRTRQLSQLALFGAPVAVLLVGGWTHRGMLDDSFINLRVVSQVLAGHGPVLNAGQRVEAFTSPAWLGALVAGDVLLPLRREWVAVVLDLLFAAVGMVLLMVGAGRLAPAADDDRLRVPAGVLALVCLTPMWTYSATGLENGLTTAWIGGCLVVLAGWARRSADEAPFGVGAAVLVGLGPLVRPELGLASVVLLAVPLVAERSRGWRALVVRLAAAGALPVLYELFRMGYYGLLVPNTALAKSAGSSRWDAGWRYLGALLGAHLLWLPLVVLLLGGLVPLVRAAGRDRRTAVAAAFVGAGLLVALYVVRVGGDYLPARLLLPALTLVVAPVAVVPWCRRHLALAVLAPWAVAGALFLRVGSDRLLWFGTTDAHPVTLADFHWNNDPRWGVPRRYERPGVYLNGTWVAPPQPGGAQRVVAEYGIGVSGYGLGVHTEVVDLLGLGEPLAAHLELERRGVNSHEKPLPLPWLVASRLAPGTPYDPALFVTGPEQREPLMFLLHQLGHPSAPFADRVAAARRALDCPPLRRLLAGYRTPLTARRFVSNLVHAPANTWLRYPAEPAAAERALCGSSGR